jgi:hypothetical protein
MNINTENIDKLSSKELSNMVNILYKKIDIAKVKEFIPYTNEVVDYSPCMDMIFNPLETKKKDETILKYDQYDPEIHTLLTDCLRGYGCRTSYLRMDTLHFISKHKIESLVPQLLEDVITSLKDNNLSKRSYGYDSYRALEDINTKKSIKALIKIGEITITPY